MSRPEKLGELTDLVQSLNHVAEIKLDGIGEYILEPNGKGFILKQRTSAKSYETLSNFKHHSIREMTKFVSSLISKFNKKAKNEY